VIVLGGGAKGGAEGDRLSFPSGSKGCAVSRRQGFVPGTKEAALASICLVSLAASYILIVSR